MKNYSVVVYDYNSKSEYYLNFDSKWNYPSDEWFLSLLDAFYSKYEFELQNFDLLNYCLEM